VSVRAGWNANPRDIDDPERRYSPTRCIGARKVIRRGNPGGYLNAKGAQTIFSRCGVKLCCVPMI
jgi:hypothetical protein